MDFNGFIQPIISALQALWDWIVYGFFFTLNGLSQILGDVPPGYILGILVLVVAGIILARLSSKPKQ